MKDHKVCKDMDIVDDSDANKEDIEHMEIGKRELKLGGKERLRQTS